MSSNTLPNAWTGLTKASTELPSVVPLAFLAPKDRPEMEYCGVMSQCGYMVEWYYKGDTPGEIATVRASHNGVSETYYCIAEDLAEALSMSARDTGEPCNSPNDAAAATFKANRAQPKNFALRFIP
jgi:hypothetical protein